MKKAITLTALSLAWLITWAQVPNSHLSDMLTTLDGRWVDTEYASQLETFPEAIAQEPSMMVEFRTGWIRGETVGVWVSEYCVEGVADLLFFVLNEDGTQLHWVGTQLLGEEVDIPQLESLTIMVEDDQSLELYVTEIDGRYETSFALKPDPLGEPIGYEWQCEDQLEFLSFMVVGEYGLFGAEKQPLSLIEAFGSEVILEDIQFMLDHPNLMKGLEEICLSAPFPVVAIGSANPMGDLAIYAIEPYEGGYRLWHTEEITMRGGDTYLQRGRFFLEIEKGDKAIPLF